MRAKRVIAGRGVGGTSTVPEHREADADDFGGESDALRPGIVFLGRKILKVLIHRVVRLVYMLYASLAGGDCGKDRLCANPSRRGRSPGFKFLENNAPFLSPRDP
jgi:hypothetical protein